MISRRLLLAAPLLLGTRVSAAEADFRSAVADLERRSGGRLGVALLDTGSHRQVAYRGDERFPMCSTFKFLAAANVLARVDRGREQLDRRVRYGRDDLVPYAPVTEKHLDDGMTIGELCVAAVTLSDNAAGNLLLDSLGGPAGLTAYVRTLGDRATRLDRRETELNEGRPGDQRDTTTPVAMLGDLQRTVLGNALSPASRTQLTDWLVANQTGAKRLRAGLPSGWRVGDKTGANTTDVTNDIAVLWPPRRTPIVVTVFYAEGPADDERRNTVIAAVGRLIGSMA